MPSIRLKFIMSGAGTSRHPGATVEFTVDDSLTGGQLRDHIRSQWPEAYADVQIDRKKINIIHSAQVLEDGRMLRDYGLGNQDPPVTLHLMLQPLAVEAVPEKENPKVDRSCPCTIL
eukprot:RCo004381